VVHRTKRVPPGLKHLDPEVKDTSGQPPNGFGLGRCLRRNRRPEGSPRAGGILSLDSESRVSGSRAKTNSLELALPVWVNRAKHMIDARISPCLCPHREQLGILVANKACGYSKRAEGAFALVMLHLPHGRAAEGLIAFFSI
jgi:hypothetical protein